MKVKSISKENSESIIRLYNKGVQLGRYGFSRCYIICSVLMKGENLPKEKFGYMTQMFNKSLNSDEKKSISLLASKYKGRSPNVPIDDLFEFFFSQGEDDLFKSIGNSAI